MKPFFSCQDVISRIKLVFRNGDELLVDLHIRSALDLVAIDTRCIVPRFECNLLQEDAVRLEIGPLRS